MFQPVQFPPLASLCRLMQGVWSWDKEALQSQRWRRDEGNRTRYKLVNLPVREQQQLGADGCSSDGKLGVGLPEVDTAESGLSSFKGHSLFEWES